MHVSINCLEDHPTWLWIVNNVTFKCQKLQVSLHVLATASPFKLIQEYIMYSSLSLKDLKTVARVRFGVICELSCLLILSLASRVFLWVLQFPSLLQNQRFQINQELKTI
jgi:hypothetical protein